MPVLPLLLAAQLVATHADAARADSVYATPALRALIARAAERNRRAPASLAAYRATMESELSIVARRPDGTEATIAIEQVRAEARWRRTGEFEQHVVGYRSQQIGLTLSMVGLLGRPWAVPVLYGNRLALLFERESGSRARPPMLAIHPFADDRDRAYRFTGGDTVAIVRSGRRDIPIARVLVEPRLARAPSPTLLFRGEVDIDAARGEVVRMRGYFVTLGRVRTVRERLALLPVTAVAFVELENAEIEGRFWLPSYQRIEAQGAVAGNGAQRSAVRIVSRFRDHRATVEGGEAVLAAADSLRDGATPADTIATHPRRRLTFAPRDSLAREMSWDRPLGAATAEVHVDDFGDIAPDEWRTTGPPRLALAAPRLSDFVRYDRVEGVFTGLSGELRLRDRLPGATIRATAGWAWSERTARGRVEGEWRRGAWVPGGRVARSLDVTNDFLSAFDSSGSALDALLFSRDDRDYVDRRSATLSLTRLIGARGPGAERAGSVRLELGGASDRAATARLSSGPFFHPDSAFRPNRGVREGRYLLSALTAELHPEVSAEFLRPGAGARLRYERGDGGLAYQRLEGRLVVRQNGGDATLAARLDAGMLLSDDPPPQQLFELGRGQGLPGYGYKEFAGDRAAVLRGLAMWRLPLWRSPLRLWRRWWLPAPAPALAVGAQSGWAVASSDAARLAIARLGSTGDAIGRAPLPVGVGIPVSRPTDGVRSTIDVGVRLFGGSTLIGLARAVDHRAPWRWVVGFAQGL